LTGRGNGLATTQLRTANDEERQLHRRAQAREFRRSKLTKRYGLKIVVAHDAVSLLHSNRRSLAARLRMEEKKEPPGELGAEGHHHEHSLQKLPLPTGTDLHASRRDSGFALSYRKYLSRIFALNLSSRLLTLFAANSGEGFPKVGINASRVTKRMIEDRFH
jgi:hypothetical protein